jgi:transcriptional antiterminator RfaH
MNGDSGRQWFLVHAKPRQEALAESRLAEQGFGVYLPRLQRPRRRHARWQEVIEPLFPRYLFVGLVCGAQSMAPIRSTPGVSALVRFGADYASVPAELVRVLRAREHEGLHHLRCDEGLRRGDRVRVEEGVFAGLTGIFNAPRGEERALVLLDMLGQQTRIEMPKGYLTRLACNAA